MNELVIFLSVILLLCACAANRQKKTAIEPEKTDIKPEKTDIKPEKTDIKPVDTSPSKSSYYYFTEAQLHRKKGAVDKAIFYQKKALEIDPDSLYLQKELAFFYLQQKDHRRALEVVQSIIRKDPDNLEGLIMFGRIKQALKQTEDAKVAFHKVIAKDPNQKSIYVLLGSLYMEENDFANARQIYQQLVDTFPDSYIGHYFLGKIFLEQGNLKGAETEFLRTLELKSNLEEPRFELINLYKIQKRDDAVIKIYEDILTKSPRHIRASMELGFFYYQKGDIRRAEVIFTDLGKRSLSDPNIIRKLVQTFLDKKKFDSSVIIIQGLLKGAPASSDLHYVAGVAYDGKGEKEKAISHFKSVLPGSKFYKSAAVHVSFLYQDLGKIEDGITYLKDVIRKIPDNPDLWMYLGTFYEETEEFEKAEEALKKGLHNDPENPKIYFRLGVVYDKWGKKESSIVAMKKVIDLDPKNANALNYLGYTYADLGKNLEEAEQLIKEALKYKPDDGYIMDSLGWVYYKKGAFEKALQYLEKATGLVPDDPVILEHLGDVYIKLNDKERALDFYHRSLQKKKKDKKNIE
ncbi:MAG: tetratricopeptide repeat protein, partial [Deltaproteobacteria bacterium]|nr:tetratricopeptide repeat protein [Deltaproteobacteria bacterium]